MRSIYIPVEYIARRAGAVAADPSKPVFVTDHQRFLGAQKMNSLTGTWCMRLPELQCLARFSREYSSLALRPGVARRKSAASYSVSDRVATVEIRGRMQKGNDGFFASTSTVEVSQAIKAAVADESVGAIMLIIDSPGGTVAGTESLANDVAAAAGKKPVIALIEDIGASAAYWVASQATKLYAGAAAMVGSIGTYGVIHDSSKAAENEGVRVHVVRAGQHKGSGTPGTQIDDAQLAEFQKEIDALNQVFLSAVASGRKMSADQVKALATGQSWVGQEAADRRLTDGVANLDQATLIARQAAVKGLAGFTADYASIAATCGVSTRPAWPISNGNVGKPQLFSKPAIIARETPRPIQRPAVVDARAEFNSLIGQKIEAGMSRVAAVRAVVNERPDLQAAVVAEANAGRKSIS